MQCFAIFAIFISVILRKFMLNSIISFLSKTFYINIAMISFFTPQNFVFSSLNRSQMRLPVSVLSLSYLKRIGSVHSIQWFFATSQVLDKMNKHSLEIYCWFSSYKWKLKWGRFKFVVLFPKSLNAFFY